MAPLKCLRIISYTSQDPCHKVENVINPQSSKKWLCSKNAVGCNLEVEIELESNSRIEHINIGNHGSNFVEVLVGRSLWNKERQFEVLLPSVSLMTASECKEWKNTSKVFMFNSASFQGHIAAQKWDVIRVKCRQPLVKDKQFGLGFIELRAPDPRKKTNESNSSGSKSNSLQNMVSKAINSSGGSESSSRKLLSRSARCLQTALSKQKRPVTRSPSLSVNTSRKANIFELSSDDDFNGTLSHDRSLTSTSLHHFGRDSGSSKTAVKVVEQNTPCKIGIYCNKPSPPASRMPKDYVSVKFEVEIRDFLKEFDIEKARVNTVPVAYIRKIMEGIRGEKLNHAEGQVFYKIMSKALSNKASTNNGSSLDAAIKSDSKPSNNRKDNTKNRTGSSNINNTDETPASKETSNSNSAEKRRNLLACRNVLRYDDDINGPPRKKSNNPPLEFTKHDEKGRKTEDDDDGKSKCPICDDLFSKVTLEIHASYCQGKSILEDDSQPTDEKGDYRNKDCSKNNPSRADSVACNSPCNIPQPGKSVITSPSVTGKAKTQSKSPVNSHTSQSQQKGKTKKPPKNLSSKGRVSKHSASKKRPTASTTTIKPKPSSGTSNSIYNAANKTFNTAKHIAFNTAKYDVSNGRSDLDADLTMPTNNDTDASRSNAAHFQSCDQPDLLLTKVHTKTDIRIVPIACPICKEMFPADYVTYHASSCVNFQ